MHPPPPGRSAAAAAGAIVFTLLTWAVTAGWFPLHAFDRAVSDALYAGDGRPALVEAVLQVLTAPGSSAFRAVAFLPVLLWLVLRRAWWTAAWVLTATALIGPLTTLAKELVGRERPPFAEGGLRYGSLSFPSGHSAGVAVLVLVSLLLAWPRLAPVARRAWAAAGLLLAVVVGATRVLLGVHFPADVVAGWAFGATWVLLTTWAFGAFPGGRTGVRRREPALVAA
ncbi:phosphatase PAP2 family protein [Modestobacter sp. SYSU DS0875]